MFDLIGIFCTVVFVFACDVYGQSPADSKPTGLTSGPSSTVRTATRQPNNNASPQKGVTKEVISITLSIYVYGYSKTLPLIISAMLVYSTTCVTIDVLFGRLQAPQLPIGLYTIAKHFQHTEKEIGLTSTKHK